MWWEFPGFMLWLHAANRSRRNQQPDEAQGNGNCLIVLLSSELRSDWCVCYHSHSRVFALMFPSVPSACRPGNRLRCVLTQKFIRGNLLTSVFDGAFNEEETWCVQGSSHTSSLACLCLCLCLHRSLAWLNEDQSICKFAVGWMISPVCSDCSHDWLCFNGRWACLSRMIILSFIYSSQASVLEHYNGSRNLSCLAWPPP